jgi:hypothetical protein
MGLLFLTLYGFDGKEYNDLGEFTVFYMRVLSFPSSLLVKLVYQFLYSYFSIVIQQSYVSWLIYWACFFVVGYFQWFVFLPKVMRLTKVSGGEHL